MEEQKETKAIVVRDEMDPADVLKQVGKIQSLMKSVMQIGQHYGVIPGTDKPTLLKPGAEKLNFMFRHIPRFERERIDLPGGHREYIVRCTLYKYGTDDIVGQGEGSCSTMESKYRYRNVSDYEETGLEIPADAKEKKSEYRKQGFGMKKVSGVWLWVKYKDAEKVENPDIADTYNTVLKMSDKRALVAATINACAASDIFTQDMEDNYDGDMQTNTPRNVTPESKPKTKLEDYPLHIQVLKYIDRAESEKYFTPTMAEGFRKEREENKNDDAHMAGMLRRIKEAVEKAKDDLNKVADAGFGDDFTDEEIKNL